MPRRHACPRILLEMLNPFTRHTENHLILCSYHITFINMIYCLFTLQEADIWHLHHEDADGESQFCQILSYLSSQNSNEIIQSHGEVRLVATFHHLATFWCSPSVFAMIDGQSLQLLAFFVLQLLQKHKNCYSFKHPSKPMARLYQRAQISTQMTILQLCAVINPKHVMNTIVKVFWPHHILLQNWSEEAKRRQTTMF